MSGTTDDSNQPYAKPFPEAPSIESIRETWLETGGNELASVDVLSEVEEYLHSALFHISFISRAVERKASASEPPDSELLKLSHDLNRYARLTELIFYFLYDRLRRPAK